jgi:hypothetical protein
MKERPILFRPEMVRAILEGRKTQTRRVVNPQPVGRILPVPSYSGDRGIEIAFGPDNRRPDGGPRYWPSPYGWTRDRLWVREAWRADAYAPDETIYLADADALTRELLRGAVPFKPSIHMPRKRCRLVLDVVDVRVERLQKISEEDARAEGCEYAIAGHGTDGPIKTYRTGYVRLWQEINAARGFGWETDPWVWVVEFKIAEALKEAA